MNQVLITRRDVHPVSKRRRDVFVRSPSADPVRSTLQHHWVATSLEKLSLANDVLSLLGPKGMEEISYWR